MPWSEMCSFESLEPRQMLSASSLDAVSGNLAVETPATGQAPAAYTAVPVKTAIAPAASTTKAKRIAYKGPIIISKGGTYSGNWQSLNPNIPAVRIRTSQPVIIQNSNIRSADSCIDVFGYKANARRPQHQRLRLKSQRGRPVRRGGSSMSTASRMWWQPTTISKARRGFTSTTIWETIRPRRP